MYVKHHHQAKKQAYCIREVVGEVGLDQEHVAGREDRPTALWRRK